MSSSTWLVSPANRRCQPPRSGEVGGQGRVVALWETLGPAAIYVPADEENTMAWRCDTCHGPIDDAQSGWVEWLRGRDGTYESGSLRLVHAATASPAGTSCQYDEALVFRQGQRLVADRSLAELVAQGSGVECHRLMSSGTWGQSDGMHMADRVSVGDA
jgi:hypothetical protein